MTEFLKNNRRSVLAVGAITGSLLLGACGQEGPVTESPEDMLRRAEENRGISIPELLPDGRRVIKIDSPGAYSASITMIEFCNGPDLMTVTEQKTNGGAAGGPDRTENHAWCADGVLTEADFSVSQ